MDDTGTGLGNWVVSLKQGIDGTIFPAGVGEGVVWTKIMSSTLTS